MITLSPINKEIQLTKEDLTMRSALPETFPSNIIINKTIRATECDTNQQHHMTQDFNFFLWSKCQDYQACARPLKITMSLISLEEYNLISKWNLQDCCVHQANTPETTCNFSPFNMLYRPAVEYSSSLVTDWKVKLFESWGRGCLWLDSHLSGFGWGLNKGNAVAAC